MKKKILLAIPMVCLLGSLLWAAAVADQDDPLASLSYLTDVFMDGVDKAIEKRLDKSDKALRKELKSSVKQDEKAPAEDIAAVWTERRMKQDDVLLGTTGTGVLLLSGGMEVYFDEGAVVDVTTGKEVKDGDALKYQHRYLVAEDTEAEFVVTTPTVVMDYQGPYEFEDSDTPDYNAMARAIRELNLFRGTTIGYGEGFELENPATRIQALVMFIRVLGEEEQALAWKGECPFRDVLDWAQPYAGYAYEMGYTNGVGPNAFAPDQQATAQQYTEFMLRAMGYSSTANTDLSDTLERAWDADVLTEGEVEALGDLETFTRAEMVYISYYSLFAELPDGLTLAETLENKDVFDSADWKSAKRMVDTERF